MWATALSRECLTDRTPKHQPVTSMFKARTECSNNNKIYLPKPKPTGQESGVQFSSKLLYVKSEEDLNLLQFAV